MTRNIGITFAMSALMVAFLAAADDAPPAKGDKEPAKKQPADQPPAKDKDAKGNEDPATPQGKPEEREEIINRLKVEFDDASSELEKSKDPRKIQKSIIDDLDKLIKEQNDQDCKNSSSSSGASGSESKSGQSQSKSSGSKSSGDSSTSQGSKSSQGEQKGSGQANKDGQKGEKGGQNEKKEDQTKKDGKGEDKKEQAHLKDGQKDNKKGGDFDGKGNADKDSKKTSSVEDLKLDIWGHLSEKKRKELDVHASERFMPKYEEILRQYYRKLAEQNSKKGGD